MSKIELMKLPGINYKNKTILVNIYSTELHNKLYKLAEDIFSLSNTKRDEFNLFLDRGYPIETDNGMDCLILRMQYWSDDKSLGAIPVFTLPIGHIELMNFVDNLTEIDDYKDFWYNHFTEEKAKEMLL